MKKQHYLFFIAIIMIIALLSSCNQTETITCNACGATIPSDVKFCSECGFNLAEETTLAAEYTNAPDITVESEESKSPETTVAHETTNTAETTQSSIIENSTSYTPEFGENTTDELDEEAHFSVELVEFVCKGDRCVGALITNNGTKQVGELEIQFLFYDAEGNIIGTDRDGHDVILPNSTVTSCASKYEVPQSYTRVDYILTIDADANSRYKNHAPKVSIETNLGENCVILQITNNAEVDIDELEYSVVFYKEGKVVDMDIGVDVRDIPSGGKVIEEYSSWGVDFDSYKVFINQAHTFGW